MSHTVSDRPLRITLVDDSDLAAAGIKVLLAPFADRVSFVENREALAHPEDLDVVLYEPLNLSGTAEALLRDLIGRVDAPTAVFSWAPVDELPTPIARPYLSKNLSASGLVVRVEDLASGRFAERSTPSEATPEAPSAVPLREVAPEAGAGRAAAAAVLTPREIDIIALIVAGLSNREISDELVLSVNSVKTYIRTAYRKMGVARRTQAMRWALDHGITLDDGTDAARPDTLVG